VQRTDGCPNLKMGFLYKLISVDIFGFAEK
jgi:hypothetical protein